MEILVKTVLQNRDEISIGERKFIFESSTENTVTNEPQGVLKAVSLNDGIDDNVTVNYSRKGNERSQRSRHSIITRNNNSNLSLITKENLPINKQIENKSSSMTISLPLERLGQGQTLNPTPQKLAREFYQLHHHHHNNNNHNNPESNIKLGLPTPVKRAIQSKRKSISWDLERLHVIQSHSDHSHFINSTSTLHTEPTPLIHSFQNEEKKENLQNEEKNEKKNHSSNENEISVPFATTTTTPTTIATLNENNDNNNPPTADAQVSNTTSIATLLDRVIQKHQLKLQQELQEELQQIEKSKLHISIPIQLPISDSLQTPHNTIRPLDSTNNSILNTPLKREIQTRRITRSAVKVLETTDSPFLTTEPQKNIESLIASTTSTTTTTTNTLTTSPEIVETSTKTPTRSLSNSNDNEINDIDGPESNTSSQVDELPLIERRITRQSLKTPLKTAIQSRRKSLVSAVEKLDKVLDDPLIEPIRSSLKTPIKKAIQAKRKSYAAQVEALDKLALTEEINQQVNYVDLPNNSSSSEMKMEIQSQIETESQPHSTITISSENNQNLTTIQEIPKILKTPLKKAIESRRKSLQKEVQALDNIITPAHNNTISTEEATRVGLQTPLKKAIHSRRKSLTSEINKLDEVNKELEENEKIKANSTLTTQTVQSNLPLPLREAIESKKYNLRTEVKILDELTYLAKLEQTRSSSISNELISIKKNKLCTPLRNALQSRRKSVRISLDGTEPTPEIPQESNNSIYALRSLQTPLKKAIQARRKSLLAEIAILEDTLTRDVNDSFADIANTITGDFEVENISGNISIFGTPFPSEVGVEYEANQLCSRLSIASFASTIGREEVIFIIYLREVDLHRGLLNT